MRAGVSTCTRESESRDVGGLALVQVRGLPGAHSLTSELWLLAGGGATSGVTPEFPVDLMASAMARKLQVT